MAGVMQDPSSRLCELGGSAWSLGEVNFLKGKCPLSHPNHRFWGDWGQKTRNATVGRVSQRASQPHLACLGPSRLLRAVLVLLRINTKRWISGEGESAAPSQGSRPVASPRRRLRTGTN